MIAFSGSRHVLPFWLAALLAFPQLANANEIVDEAPAITVRNGMHTCPVGRYVIGVHVANNQLLCSSDFPAYQLAQEYVNGDNEPVTVRLAMHACPAGSAVTGIHVVNNWLACAPISGGIKREFVDGPPPTVRSNMHACPEGYAAVGIHVGNNQLLCGATRANPVAFTASGLSAATQLPPSAVPIETFDDKCRTKDVVLAFDHWFGVDGATQLPQTSTGPFVVVTKGTSGVLIPLTDRRFRWYCGEASEAFSLSSAAGPIADQGGAEAQGKCIEALSNGDDNLIATECSAVGSVINAIIQGLLGNWEAARCAQGTTKVKLDYHADGTLIWNCYH